MIYISVFGSPCFLFNNNNSAVVIGLEYIYIHTIYDYSTIFKKIKSDPSKDIIVERQRQS
jgi:hypothetical protein